MLRTDPPIIISCEYPVSPIHLWNILTDVSHQKLWFFPQLTSFKPVVGFKTQFALSHEDRTFTHLWEVVKVEEAKLLTLRWHYEEYDGDGFVHFRLSETENGTQLIVSDEIIADYPQDIPEFKRESGVEGWTYLLKDSLKKYVDTLSDLPTH